MSAVSELIVREYFESLGFLVRQPRKYQVSARPKQAEEEIDMLVVNPARAENVLPESPDIIWNSSDLSGIARAVVGVRGWHTERFSPSVVESSPEIFRFAEKATVDRLAGELGAGQVARILCLPDLTSQSDHRMTVLQAIRARGIDGVILFPTMLLELAEYVDVNCNYEKSDLLQVLRILKNYDLLKDAQLELFKVKRRKPHA